MQPTGKRWPRTTQQPQRSILRRFRDRMGWWAELECGHIEPCNGLPMATTLRCQECLPVHRPNLPHRPDGP